MTAPNDAPIDARPVHYGLLSCEEIKRTIQDGEVRIEPLLQNIDPCSVDVRLDNLFGVFVRSGEGSLDPGVKSRVIELEDVAFFAKPYFIQPLTFVLAQTLEFVSLGPSIVAHLDGRSSLARRGLVVHVTAGTIDPGWRGHITLELANLGEMPIALYPTMRIGRLSFQRLAVPSPYQGQFNNQLRIRAPKVDAEVERIRQHAEARRRNFEGKLLQIGRGPDQA